MVEQVIKEKTAGGRSVVGRVVSDKMTKTVVVKVESKVKHKLGKYVKRFSKMHAHDDMNCKIDDIVLIKPSRPLSKTKHWIVAQVLEKAEQTKVE